MPVYWQGSTVVGTSGGTDTSGNPINPQGIVGGIDYGGGVGASAPSGSQPVPGKKGVYTYTDSRGNVHYVEDYSSQGGGKYDTILSGPALLTSHSGSGYERQRAALLNNPSLRAAIGSNPQIRSAYEQHGLLSYEVDGRQFRTQKEADKYAAYLNQQKETEVKRPTWLQTRERLPTPEEVDMHTPVYKHPENLQVRYKVAKDWWETQSPAQKAVALVAGSLHDFDVASEFIQVQSGQKYNPKKDLFASLRGIDGFNTSLPSDYGYISKLYQQVPRKSDTLLEKVKKGAIAGVTGDAFVTAVSMAGLGYGAGLLRVPAGVLRAVGTGATVAVGADVASRAYSGAIGSAAVEGAVFIGSVPFFAAGYQAGRGNRIPTEKMFGMTRFTENIKAHNLEVGEGPLKLEIIDLKDVAQHNAIVRDNIIRETPLIAKMFGMRQRPIITEARVMDIAQHNLDAGERRTLTLLEKMFGRENLIYFIEPKQAVRNIPIRTKLFGAGGGKLKIVEPKLIDNTWELQQGLLKSMEGEDFLQAYVGGGKSKISTAQKMFGVSGYQKPRKPSVLDIMLVQPRLKSQVKPVFRRPPSKTELIEDTEYGYDVYNRLYTKMAKDLKLGPAYGIGQGSFTSIKVAQNILSPQKTKTRTPQLPRSAARTEIIIDVTPRTFERTITSQVQKTKTLVEQITEQVTRQRTRQKITTETRGRYEPMEKIIKPPLSVPKFKATIDKYKRDRSRRGQRKWDIRNPVPTLSTLLGTVERKTRYTKKRKGKK